MKFALIWIFSIASIATVTGCKMKGTEGGNPGVTFSDSPTSMMTDVLIDNICQSRARCLGHSDSQCAVQLLSLLYVTDELRLNPPFRTLQEVKMAEASDEIQVEFSEFQSCVQAVKTASCDSDMAKAAFKTDSYEGSGLILRSSPSCSQALFSKK